VLQVFLCALISRPVRAHTRVQLIRNIGDGDGVSGDDNDDDENYDDDDDDDDDDDTMSPPFLYVLTYDSSKNDLTL